MTMLEDIVKRGQLAFEATLPTYARREVSPAHAIGHVNLEPAETLPNIYLPEERQREMCLNCPLADCVGIERRDCPIQIEQRAEWRRQNHRRATQ